jgi:hypothetical protein
VRIKVGSSNAELNPGAGLAMKKKKKNTRGVTALVPDRS